MPLTQLKLSGRPDELLPRFAKIRADAGVQDAYPEAALRELRAPVTGVTVSERADLRALPLRTLDPAGSMDLDQAFSLERLGSGYVINYAIADVAAFVDPGGALDEETHRRAMTIYCPDERVPLHPAQLCEGEGSLLPGQDRPAVVWQIEVSRDGAITGSSVRRAIVRSRSRHSYDEAQAALDGPGDVDEQWRLLAEIGQARLAQQDARGGVSLSLPEQEITRTAQGWRLSFRAVAPVEDYNAQLSLTTGIAAAQIMINGGAGVLRTMPPAAPEALAKLRLRARALGIAWGGQDTYGDVLARVSSATPAGAAFLNAAASLFRGAAWTPFDGAPPEATTHAAIAAPYAHVTAPLRRLVDRYGTEACLALSAGVPVPGWVREALPDLGETMADGARRESGIGRACTELVEAAVLRHRVGEVFDAVAISSSSVQIADPAVVARCTPVTGKDLPLGEALRARLVTADLDTATVAFRQVG